jgi:phosphate transport system permease protein
MRAMLDLRQDSSSISRPPTRWEIVCDVCFRGMTHCAAWLTVALVLYIVYQIARPAMPAIREYGFDFLKGRTWDPNQNKYGILPEIWGTFYSSVLALVLGTVLGLAVAIFLSERFLSSVVFAALKLFGLQHHRFWGRLPDSLEGVLKNLVELLAAIPSVVYGLWGIFVIIPLIRPPCDWLYDHLKVIPLFSTTLGSGGMLPAAVVLAIMIVPTVTAISRDALVSVPPKLREAAYGLGATRWEALTAVILPTARIGIFGAVLLAFGRALGETMALAMLVGCRNVIDVSLFSPANTLAALMANSFSEAGPNPKLVGVLMYAALVLLGITLLVNILGALLLQSTSRGLKGGR